MISLSGGVNIAAFFIDSLHSATVWLISENCRIECLGAFSQPVRVARANIVGAIYFGSFINSLLGKSSLTY